MEILKYIPGFRSGNNIKKIIAVAFYIRCLLGMLTMDWLIFIGFILLPFVVFGVIDIITNKDEIDLKKEIFFCIIPTLLFGLIVGKVFDTSKSKEYYKRREVVLNEYIEELKEEKISLMEEGELLKKGKPIEFSQVEEIDELKSINKELRIEIDSYKKIIRENKVTKNNESNKNTSSNNNVNQKHIGYTAYISNADRYYHKSYNCKYLKGSSSTKVTVSKELGKFECKCWNNPVVSN